MSSGESGSGPNENAPNFVHELVAEQVAAGKNGGQVHTRFPPEPNGYLHIGHAKAICVDFGTAQKFGGLCNLRFDDTNPVKEDTEYVEAIQRDIRWLGFDWGERMFYASDYYEQLYQFAQQLIRDGKAYVDSQSFEQIREGRGDFHKPGRNSPFRDRPVEESLDLFARMRAGEFEDGAHVLRAKIDMAAGNLNMRDPVLYRIKRAHHHRTGDAWPIYPMYDYAHCISDALEGITHSLCSLEFEDHRPLYDWVLAQLPVPGHPQQIEFARLNLTYTMTSKRKLQAMITEGLVEGWDDPRMPTLAGLRRRGVPPEVLIRFCERIGVAKRDSVVDVALLEHMLREHLNAQSSRVMAVQRPLKVVITNYPEDGEDWFDAENHPEYPERGQRKVPFCREIYVERDDFRMDAPKKWFRLAPGKEVRLRYACLITCVDVITDPDTGEVQELHCTWDPDSKGGAPADGRRVRGTLHWVSARHALDAEIRLYDRLFTEEDPAVIGAAEDIRNVFNPDSMQVLTSCKVEPYLKDAAAGTGFQFERLGYYVVDPQRGAGDVLRFNQTVSLRDTWAKLESKLAAAG